jgi:hypothetical protein
MQKWEYCAVVGLRRSGNNTATTYFPSIEYYTSAGMHVVEVRAQDKREEITRMAQAIAQLGEDGWEMVGCGNNSEVTHSIYFKRPLAQQA